jgi:4'-phosphopantetheinyl transferase
LHDILRNAPRSPDLDEVVIWSISVADALSAVGNVLGLLHPQERARASRYRDPAQGARFALTRAALRLIISVQVGRAAEDLEFDTTPLGQPFLVDMPMAGRLRFSVSHSYDWALCAVTLDDRIGIDIERLRSLDYRAVGCIAFSEEEQATLKALPAHDRQEAFFRLWTFKEAYGKARGLGIAQQLPVIRDGCGEDLLFELLHNRTSLEAPDGWLLSKLVAPPGYVAALALENCEKRIVECQFPIALPGGADTL